MIRYITLLLALLVIGSCGKGVEEKIEARPAVAITSGDECHLCGMMITEFAGPKGQVFHKGHQKAFKFCSTRDLFSHLLQPENQRQVSHVWVHDMSKAPWDKPDDSQFIDGKSAWYVHGSSQTGAMGKTLATFADKMSAEAFAKEYGGKVVDFNAVNLELLW